MGSSCSTVNTNIVDPLSTNKDEKEEKGEKEEEEEKGKTEWNWECKGEFFYRSEPVAVVGVRGIRELKSVGSDYWDEKYVGNR